MEPSTSITIHSSICSAKMERLSLSLLVVLSMTMCTVPFVARAGDPDILTDFLVPPGTNSSLIDGAFFTYTKLITSNSADPARFTASKATAAEFPALLGQSVSYAALVFGPRTVNPPHIHPRASELLYVMQGPLSVGLIDAAAGAGKGKVYTQTLQTGDMFVFPKGMVHFQFNDGTDVARAFSAFGGASPGTISLPGTLFETGIDDAVLQKSLHTDEATVEELKQDLAPPAVPVPSPPPPPPAVPVPSPPPPPPSTGGAAMLSSRSALTLLCLGAAFLF